MICVFSSTNSLLGFRLRSSAFDNAALRIAGDGISRLVEQALNLPASPFKMHIGQAKGGWMSPAANLARCT
jgi:hypothetical protein